MGKHTYAAIAFLLLVVSCSKTNEPVATVKNEVDVKVYNTTTWNSQTNKMDTVVGATVNLISDSATVTAVTNNEGIATFSNVKEKTYYLVATKNNLSNLLNQVTTNNETVGNLIIGVYTSQADIASSAKNSNAIVGGSKLADVNGDGWINSNDKVQGNFLRFEYNYKDVNGDGIIDAKDVVNGSLMKIDTLVKVNVFIGD